MDNLILLFAFSFVIGVCCSLKVIEGMSDGSSTQGMLTIVKSAARSITADRSINEQVNLLTLGNSFDSSSLPAVDTDAAEATETDGYNHFAMMQNFLKYSFAPLVQQQQASTLAVTSGADAYNGNTERYTSLHKCLRELDTALDQIQRGDGILRPDFNTLPELSAASSQTTAADLKNHLEKFNPSNVDQLFDSFEPSLLVRMGETPQQKDAFANEVHKVAKQWPVEIGKLVRVVELPISSNNADPFLNIESEVKFWKDLNKILAETKETLVSDPQVLLTKLMKLRCSWTLRWALCSPVCPSSKTCHPLKLLLPPGLLPLSTPT